MYMHIYLRMNIYRTLRNKKIKRVKLKETTKKNYKAGKRE